MTFMMVETCKHVNAICKCLNAWTQSNTTSVERKAIDSLPNFLHLGCSFLEHGTLQSQERLWLKIFGMCVRNNEDQGCEASVHHLGRPAPNTWVAVRDSHLEGSAGWRNGVEHWEICSIWHTILLFVFHLCKTVEIHTLAIAKGNLE